MLLKNVGQREKKEASSMLVPTVKVKVRMIYKGERSQEQKTF